MEPNDTNVNQCYTCGTDTFYFWIEEQKKKDHDSNILCLRCANKAVNTIKENREKYHFFYKYDYNELNKFFKRIEGKLLDPNYIDTGKQISILIKADWPEVRTKQDLKEEGLPCIFYGDSDGKSPDSSGEVIK